MKLHELKTSSPKKAPKRKGRGIGTGNGKTAGRGHKGQNSRSGGGTRPGFEGGQMPLYRRIPKRGFTNISTKNYAIINIESLNVFNDGDTVTIKELIDKGLVKKAGDGVKILGNGELKKKLTIKAKKFTGKAEEKIKSAGGNCEVIS